MGAFHFERTYLELEIELLDICDEQGNPTGETVERDIAHRDGILHRTAHVWIVRNKEKFFKRIK